MGKLLGQYKVLLYNPDGTRVAEFDAFRRLEVNHLVNFPGTCTLTLNGRDSRANLFETNSIVEVWRKVPGYTPSAVPASRRREGDWYVEWEGLHSDIERTVYQNGDEVFISRSDGYLDLVQRREILWKASKTVGYSKKSGPAQTVIYEFVKENCGSDALLANGRLIDGNITGFSLAADAGLGDTWYGGRAYRNVLEVIQDIGNYAGIDFDVVGQGGASWLFVMYLDQLGEDRTTSGLDTSTGQNSAGNAPVIFSIKSGNVQQVTYKSTRRTSANVVAALGKGQYDQRSYEVETNASEIDVERINQREVTRNCNMQDTSDELTTSAQEWLQQKQAIEDFTFLPLRSFSTVYGVHYWWGDKITARAFGLERDKRLLGLSIVVDSNVETFQNWNFQTIPRYGAGS